MLLSMATQEAVHFLSGCAPAEVAKPTVIMGTIAIARNPVAHARTNIRYHYIREAVQEGRNWFGTLNLLIKWECCKYIIWQVVVQTTADS